MPSDHTSHARDRLPAGNPDLHRRVRAAFIVQNTTLKQWCVENGVTRSWAEAALQGKRSGPAARALVVRILDAAGVSE